MKHHFSKKERITWVLLAGALLIFILMRPKINQGHEITTLPVQFMESLDSLITAVQLSDSISQETKARTRPPKASERKSFRTKSHSKTHMDKTPSKSRFQKKYESFSFDPNTIDIDSLEKLLPAWMASNIDKYRSKGGQFRSASDLQKIYGMDSMTYNRLEPHIRIIRQAQVPQKKESFIVDINLADTAEWQMLRGIGPVLSKRIVTFREALGGFHSIDQINEVYGLEDETFAAIQSQLKVSALLKEIEINDLNKEALANHPYISWKLARTIVMYREQHGPFANLIDFKQIRSLNDSDIQRISPYLRFNTELESPSVDLTIVKE